MKTYSITHTNPDGSGVALAHFRARSMTGALKQFHQKYPQRTAGVIGILGEE